MKVLIVGAGAVGEGIFMAFIASWAWGKFFCKGTVRAIVG